MVNKQVLIVDDEPDILELLEITLSGMGYQSIKATTVEQAMQQLANSAFFLCLTDMRLPDGDGINLVKYIQKNYPELPVAVITAFGNVEGAVNTLKAGAFDYVSKPISLSSLKKLIQSAHSLQQPQAIEQDEQPADKLIGKSNEVVALRKKIAKLARSQAPVFIHGESGVGKELVARLIHQQGPRANEPFIPVNCGAIPTELMESEFFGHKKGSFTGAQTEHQGLFQAANGGTLFLDEVAELPLHMQVKLLRAIQEKAIKPIGYNQEINVDVRILSATHKDLLNEIAQEKFRQDLYYRINVIELKVPSLRERSEDISLLVNALLAKFTEYDPLPTVSKDAIKALSQYAFPGNVRELENILERALTLCDSNEITADDLMLPAHENVTATEALALNQQGSLDNVIDNQQKALIIKALDDNKWNRTAAAKQLGITFRALRYRLKKLDIE